LAVKSTLSSTPKSEISYIEGAKYLESKTKEGNDEIQKSNEYT